MVCFSRQKSDYVKGKKKLKSKHNEHVATFSLMADLMTSPVLYCTALHCTVDCTDLLPDGGPDDLPLLVLFAILLPPLPLRLLDGFLSEQQNNLRAIQGL